MTPEQWARVETLYHAARELALEARSRFLDDVCGGDDWLRREVESLLAEPVSGEDLLGAPAGTIAAAMHAALSPLTGQTLGGYELRRLLGAGGMGEVYLAHDPRLRRDVAIKILPVAFTRDADRLARFEREARMLAALNHPNICAIHGVEQADGIRFLILELVEGMTLAARVTAARTEPGGPGLPMDEALSIARQIADALEAAHDKGIIHRDLKPANICITPDGVVKVLDFGLAKPVGMESETHADLQTSAPSRGAGLIVGTVAYMSPEQARGLAVDRRTDIWAFGCVLFEMLTGRPAFGGETDSDSLARVLEREPDWDALPADMPPAMRRVLRRTLAKTMKQRLKDAGDVRLELEALDEPAPAVSVRRRTHARWIPWAAALMLVTAIAAWQWRRPGPIDANPLADASFTPLTGFDGAEVDAAISPDGQWVAFLADVDGTNHVWLNQVDTGLFRNLTPGAGDHQNPGMLRSVGFSGDGSELWFTGDVPPYRLQLMPLMGGAPRAFLPEKSINVVWSPDRSRLAYFTVDPGDPIFVADGQGGTPRQIHINPSGDHNHFLAWSPDGRWLYFAQGRQSVSEFDIWRIPSQGGTPERLTELNTNIRYLVAIDARMLLFVAPDENKGGPWLWALDIERKATRRISTGLERYLSIAATPDGRRLVASVAKPTASLWSVPIRDGVSNDSDVAAYTASVVRALAPRFTGSALYVLSSRAGADGLWRLQNGGAQEIWKGSDGALTEPASISPRGDWIAILLRKPAGVQLTLVSSDGAVHRALSEGLSAEGTTAWSPDGTRLVVGGNDGEGRGLFLVDVQSGALVRLTKGPAYDPAWSPDGSLIVYASEQRGGAALRGIRPDGTAVPLPQLEALPRAATRARRRMASARFLPDGRGFVFMHGPPGMQAFWLMDLTTKSVRMVARVSKAGAIRTFDITPDGSRIVFDRVEERADLVLIERH